MCAVCVEIAKGTINWKEAENALPEVIETIDNEHLVEVEEMIANLKDDDGSEETD